MPHLILIEKGSGKTHRVDATDVVAGRDPACGIVVEGENAGTVSGRHARFFLEDGAWFVEDAGSRNGTYLGTRRLEPGTRHALTPGDVVGLGLTGTQLSVYEAVAKSYATTLMEPAPAGVADPAGSGVRIVLRDSATGARWRGLGDRVTLGRALVCVIRLEGESATTFSRVHAVISAANGRILIQDAGSRHGTLVNGRKLEAPAALTPGDTLTLGTGGPVFVVEEAAIASAEPRSEAVAGPGAIMEGDADGSFKSEIPTPPVARAAAARPAKRSSPSPRRKTVDGSAKPLKLARATRSPVVVMAALVILSAVIATFFALQRTRATRAALAEAQETIAQQAAALDSARAVAAKEAGDARAAFDSASAAAADPAVLDSIRKVIADAERRAAKVPTDR
jgi:pSer/pThr/pTyr-binding forkhead associated (FHA) protein